METIIVDGYTQYGGQHPHTAALKNVLACYGVIAPHSGEPFTEAMLLGIGGLGAGYILWEFGDPAMKAIVLGFHSHWQYPERYMGHLCDRLNIAFAFKSTGGQKTAAKQLQNALANRCPAVAWVDPSGLPYRFPRVPLSGHHGHVVGVFGLDEDRIILDDLSTKALATSQDDFAAARARIGSYKNRLMLVEAPNEIDVKAAITQAIAACVEHLSEKSDSFSLPTFRKWARLLTDTRNKKGWSVVFADRQGIFSTLKSIYEGVEPIGTTGGSLRDMYADFLTEAAPLFDTPELAGAAALYRKIAALWHSFAEAALPDSIAGFKETKELLAKWHRLFTTHGLDSLAEMQTISERLHILESEYNGVFPMSDAETKDLFADMQTRLFAIYEAEVKALNALQRAI